MFTDNYDAYYFGKLGTNKYPTDLKTDYSI